MAIFDNELINNISQDGTLEVPSAPLGSPKQQEVNTSLIGVANPGGSQRQLGLDELSALGNSPNPKGFAGSFEAASQAELNANKRYPVFQRGVDLENINAIQQPWYQQLAYGAAKGLVTLGGTFAQSLSDIPNTISAIKNTDVSKLSGNPEGYEGAVDNWVKGMEDVLPNYYSRWEKEHPFKSVISAQGAANFWGDKFIKNLGFMGGAILGAAAQDLAVGVATEAVGEIPLLANQIGKASLWLSKIATGTNDVEKVIDLGRVLGKSEQQLNRVQKIGELAAASRLSDQFRYGMAIYGSALTEAGMEARDGYRQVKEELTKQYKLQNAGAEPDFQTAQSIETYATQAMNTRFGINMAILTASNALMLGNVFKSMVKGETSALTGGLAQEIADAGKVGLKEGSIDVFEKKTAESLASRVWDSVRPNALNIFSEGVYEEGGQYAAEKGTYDYYTRKYKSDKYRNEWNSFNEIIKSTTLGMKEQFGSTEGLENMLIGGLTGLIMGKVMNVVDNKRGVGSDARLASTLNVLNRYGITDTLQNAYDTTVNSVGIAKDMAEAAATGNVYQYKNLKEDMFFNLVTSRIPSGMHDITIEQLKMMKELPKDQFEKAFQIDFNESNKKTVDTYVDALITKADEIKSTVDAINNTFKNPFKNNPNVEDLGSIVEAANHDTFEKYKTDLARFATTTNDVNDRLDSIQESLTDIYPGISTDLLEQLTNKKGLTELKDLYEERAVSLNKSITDLTSAVDRKNIKAQVKALRTNSERINELLESGKIDSKTFEKILNFELNGQDGNKDNVVPIEKVDELLDYGVDINKLLERKNKASEAYDKLSTKDGFEKYFQEAEKMKEDLQAFADKEEAPKTEEVKTETPAEVASFQFTNAKKQKENLEVGRDYEMVKAVKAKVNKVDNDRFQVISPDGTYKMYPTEEKAKEAAADLDELFANIGKVTIKGLNPDGSVKIEDKNGDIYDIDPRNLYGFQKLQTEQEKLQKIADSLAKQQTALETKSGTVSTGDQSAPVVVKEPSAIPASELFISSTGASEGSSTWTADTNIGPHVIRTREFLNNLKNLPNKSDIKVILVTPNQEDSLGLYNLSATSYNVSAQEGTSPEFKKKVTNVDNGLVAAVYIVQSNGKNYFIDKDGNQLGEVGKFVDVSKVVFSTMPSTSLTNSKGEPRYISSEKEQAEAYAKAWAAQRAELFDAPLNTYKVYDFAVSRGFAVQDTINGKPAKNHVGDNLIPEKKIKTQQNLIVISTTGTISHNGKNYKFPVGRPVLQYGDTLQFLNNRTFNAEEAKSIFEAIRLLSEDVQAKAAKGKTIEFNPLYATFLQNVLYWRKSSDTSNNQIYIDTNNMDLYLGGKKYDFSNIAASEQAIVAQLKGNTFNAINNSSLKETAEPFVELYFEDGYLKDREWPNYQSYLLSSKYPNGKSRSISDTPLSTSVAKPTAEVPYNFKQKYVTLQGMELPVQKVATTQAVAIAPEEEAVKIGEYTIDNKTENTRAIKVLGDVKFTARIDENGKVVVRALDAANLEDVAEDAEKMKPYIEFLKGIGQLEADKTNEQLLLKFASLAISNQLETIKGETEMVPTVVNEAPKAEEIVVAEADELEAELQAEIDRQVAESTKDFSKTKAPDDTAAYRRTGDGGVSRISDAELQIFKDWHAKNAANIPYEVLENMYITHDNLPAWGAFEKGVAKFFRMAERGTEYHEIFHGIFKGFLTEDQRQSIFTEMRDRKGTFKPRGEKKTIDYADATDQQLEDKLADEFAEFRLGKLPARSLGEKVLKFFRNIVQFVKDFVGKPTKAEELFKAVEAGKFKDATLSPSAKTALTEYRAVDGLNQQQTHNFVQDMTARVFQIAFGNNVSLFNPERLTAPEIFANIKAKYKEEGKYDLMGDVAWNQLVKKTKEYLRTFKISFDSENELTINDENLTRLDYAPEPFSTDWKKTSSFPIKLVMGTLVETVPTNQENSFALSLPKPSFSADKGFKLLSFSRAFATTLDKLANTNKVSKVVDKLLDLAKADSNYVRLFTRLRGTLGNADDAATIDFSKFKDEDWRLFINFYQSFTKQKPNARIQYVSGTEVYTGAADLFNATESVKNQWVENIKVLAKDDKSIIRYKDKKYTVGDVSKTKINTPEEMLSFLKELGVDFPMEAYLKLKPAQKNYFAAAVSGISTGLQSRKEIMSIDGKILGINGPLTKIAELLVKVTNPNQDPTHLNVEGERTNSYSENNATSLFENQWSEAGTLENLKQERPELNDVFSTNSVVLKKGGSFVNEDGDIIKQLKVGYIQGTNYTEEDKGISTSKLSLGSRYTQEINQNINGAYYVLMPGDSSTEWLMTIGNHITFGSVANGTAWSKLHNIFKGYLKDDIALAKDADARKKLKNIGDRAYDLRFFKDLLSDDLLAKINTDLINKEVSEEEINKFIEENEKEINDAVTSYVEDMTKNTIDILKANNEIYATKAGNWNYTTLDSVFANNNKLNREQLSEDRLNNVINFANINYVINNVEFHKILFGDPYQFAIKDGQLEETKRIKSFLSPRRTTFDTPEYNTYLNELYNVVDGVELTEGDPGFHGYKSYINTVTISEIEVEGTLMGKTKEADAQSWIMDGTYKEAKLKNAQWTKEAEEWHQWQMAYTRNKLAEKGDYTYTSKSLQKHDSQLIAKPEPDFVTDVLKPIVTGNKYNKSEFNMVLDKFSQMPIYYKSVEGTNLENLYTKMFKEKVGYAIVQSGRKLGIEGMHNLYVDGKFNEAPFADNTMVQVPWKAYGIQVENSYSGAKEQTRGSQGTKISTIDLYDKGVAVSEAAKKEVERNTAILDQMHDNAYHELLLKLGIEDLGDSFKLVDPTAVSESLEYEMLRRELSDNAIDTIQLDDQGQFRIPFEASPAYKQIKDILYSIVNKTIISPKMSGGSHVQAAVTGWEKKDSTRGLAIKRDGKWVKISSEEYSALSEEEKKKVALTDNTLKFYSKEDPYCEVMLPHWFGEKLKKGKYKTDAELLNYLNKTEEGKNILKGIGFRIPTQALSSMEVFRVKGFLPKSMGSTVIVPSEITTKSGSDFDIDKLNMYLKATYVDKNGDLRLIKYLGSEQATKEFFAGVYDDVLATKKIKKAELLEAFQIYNYNLDDPNNLVDRYAPVIDMIMATAGDINDTIDIENNIMKELEKMGDVQLQSALKSKFVKDMYKKSLENEYYDSLEKLLTLPENFKKITTPVGDAGLKDLANKIGELKGINQADAAIKNKMLNRNYLTAFRQGVVTAKGWVGIAAVNITGHSQTQKANVFIDPSRFFGLSELDIKYLGDGSIVLPHNTVEVNGQTYTSISGVKTADDKEYISDRLSGYGTSFVDANNNLYINKIITSGLAVGTFMFLERIGVGERTSYFMNQPIITQYLAYLDSLDTKNLFNKDNIAAIQNKFPTTSNAIMAAGIDINNLENNIKDYYTPGVTFSETRNAEQIKILQEFLKYAKMAEQNFEFTQAINYDTTRFKSGDSFFRKTTRTDLSLEKNIFVGINDVISNSFIGKQKEILDYSMEGMGEILKLEQNQFRTGIINPLLTPYATNKYLSADKFEQLSARMKASFLDYIIQTKTGLNEQINELFVNSGTAVATQLAEARKVSRNPILNDLDIKSSLRANGPKTVYLKVNIKGNAYDENRYQGLMRELRDTPATRKLYDNLVKLGILQGSYQTGLSITNIIPIEDYAKYVTPIIAPLVNDETLSAFSDGMFQRNNFKNMDVWKKFNPKFFLVSEDPVDIQVNDYGDEVGDIYQYHSQPYFPHNPDVFGSSTDRRVLTLTEEYNSFYIANDYIIVPRVVQNNFATNERVDMITGESVTNYSYIERKKQGDTSLNDVFGYKKVKYADGTPLTFTETDYRGNTVTKHVYKLINLYGDGNLVSEYYQDFRPSILDNGTIKIANEIPDDVLINHFGNKQIENKAIKNEEKTEYVIDKTLKNADGSKRFASTDGTNIKINPPATVEEFFDYFEGKEGGPSSAQKAKVLAELAKNGWTLETIKSTLNTPELIINFLALHEQDHIANNDKDVYWLNGKDLLTDDKIAIETRATVTALNKILFNKEPNSNTLPNVNNFDTEGSDNPNPCGTIA